MVWFLLTISLIAKSQVPKSTVVFLLHSYWRVNMKKSFFLRRRNLGTDWYVWNGTCLRDGAKFSKAVKGFEIKSQVGTFPTFFNFRSKGKDILSIYEDVFRMLDLPSQPHPERSKASTGKRGLKAVRKSFVAAKRAYLFSSGHTYLPPPTPPISCECTDSSWQRALDFWIFFLKANSSMPYEMGRDGNTIVKLPFSWVKALTFFLRLQHKSFESNQSSWKTL